MRKPFPGSKMLPLMVMLLVLHAASAHADPITTLTVEQTTDPSGLFRYEYPLTNEASGNVSAGALALDVSPAADLQELTGPAGWDITYATGDDVISWVSSDPTFDLLPGT